MLIECKLKRDGGTKIVLDKETYHFAKDKDGAHVCSVENKAHIKVLLGIPEAYNELGKEPEVIEPEVITPDEPVNPELMSNKDLNAWAKERGMNPKNKKSIADYAMDNYEIELEFDKNISCADLIREVVKVDLEEAEAEAEAES